MKKIIFDFETRSMCDLKKHAAFIYSHHPTTRPTCMCFKARGSATLHFLNFENLHLKWSELFENPETRATCRFWKSAIDNEYEFAAHNVFFDKCIYKNILVERYGWPEIPEKLWRCTAAKAAVNALPRSLAGAGEALGLEIQKDFRGHAAVMKTCKPTKAWSMWRKLDQRLKSGERLTNKSLDRLKDLLLYPGAASACDTGTGLQEPRVFLDPQDDPQIWNTLYEYCKIDVLATEQLDLSLPNLIDQELEIWQLNQKLNWRGVRVDIPLVRKIVGIIDIESKIKRQELDTLTMGLITKPGARNSILEFLKSEGVELKNLQNKTVDDKLAGFELTEDATKLLELRKALSLTSTKKYGSFLNRSSSDDRVRDLLLYHGASTGRDTGMGLQVHNFPRGVVPVDKKRPYAHVENVLEENQDMLKILYGDSLQMVFSSILRNMIIPSAGHVLLAADFSKIEVAVLWWLAGNKPGLDILEKGLDPYIFQSVANTGKTYAAIGEKERQLGKAQILGCSYGMGAKRFKTTAWDMYRLKLSDEESKKAINDYRNTNAAVPILWRAFERAAIAVTKGGRGDMVNVSLCTFLNEGDFLRVRLPSGRKLSYHSPKTGMKQTEYGESEALFFHAVNSKTKKWSKESTWGGTLTENIVQAVARDILMLASVRLEKAGYKILFTVHDEVVCEILKEKADVSDFIKIMCNHPPWAKGLPLTAVGWKDVRYRK